MPFKSLFSPVGADRSDEDVAMALALAREAGAHLTVLALEVAPLPPITAYGAVPSEVWVSQREEEIGQLRERADAIRHRLRSAEVSGEVAAEYCDTGYVSRLIGEHARYADLTLLGPDLLGDADLKTHCLNGALFESGRAVLIAPHGAAPTLRPKRIAVAWDGGVEAARAVREALPLLADSRTDIVMVDPVMEDGAGRREPGADIAAYIARHGASVVLHQVPSGGRSVAETLRAQAMDLGAEMLVMGAYGHSRLRERIFGGTTRSMVEEPSIPILAAR